MTLHSIVLANVLKNPIPTPVNDIISLESPKYNHVNADIIEWMNRHNTGKLKMLYLIRDHHLVSAMWHNF